MHQLYKRRLSDFASISKNISEVGRGLLSVYLACLVYHLVVLVNTNGVNTEVHLNSVRPTGFHLNWYNVPMCSRNMILVHHTKLTHCVFLCFVRKCWSDRSDFCLGRSADPSFTTYMPFWGGPYGINLGILMVQTFRAYTSYRASINRVYYGQVICFFCSDNRNVRSCGWCESIPKKLATYLFNSNECDSKHIKTIALP